MIRHAVVRGRVNPLVPAAVAAAGLVIALTGHAWIGSGVAVGGVLAYLNALVLWRRVDLAAGTGDTAGALLIMQAGLVVTMTLIGVATVVMIKLSPPMALAAIAGFGATQLTILGAFFLAHGRGRGRAERQAT